MANYQTRPLRLLMDHLSTHSETSYTVDELFDALLREYGASAPGKSTLYRLMTRLEKEKKIKRFEKEGSHRSHYQLISCTHNHLHLKCTDCGKLFHMEETSSKHLLEDVLNDAGFSIDQQQTVLLGKCAGCNKNRGKE